MARAKRASSGGGKRRGQLYKTINKLNAAATRVRKKVGLGPRKRTGGPDPLTTFALHRHVRHLAPHERKAPRGTHFHGMGRKSGVRRKRGA